MSDHARFWVWSVALVVMCLFLGAVVGRRRGTERLFCAAYALCGSSVEAEDLVREKLASIRSDGVPAG
jgi:hypothetical protein